MIEHNFPPRPSVMDCIAYVASQTGVTVEEITGKSRKARITEARQAAMYEARKHTGKFTTTIGRVFNRDHSTIIYGCQAHAERAGLPLLGDANPDAPALKRARYRENYWRSKAKKLEAQL